MAPRRGGGSGGAYFSSSDDSPWDEEIQLYGSHFHDPNIRAVIVIYGICFVAALVIAIWAVVVRKNNRPLRWGVLAFSIFMSIIYFGSVFAYLMIADQEFTFKVVYFLVDTILESSSYLAEISLLGFIFIVRAACLQDLGVKAAFKTAFKVSSLILISVLIAFWAAILALQIKYQVNSVIHPSKVDLNEAFVWTKLEITYYAIFVSASIELLASAMWIISGQRKQESPTWIGIFLASLVSIPVLIRSLFYLGFLAASLTRDINVKASVAQNFFTNICFILAYIGVLLVAMRFKKERSALGDPGKFGPPWTNTLPVQHQSYPPRGVQYGPPYPPVVGNGTAPHGGAPFGNPSYSSPQQPSNRTTADYGNSQYSEIDTGTAYQAQNQYNAQHSPVSPELRENSLPTNVR